MDTSCKNCAQSYMHVAKEAHGHGYELQERRVVITGSRVQDDEEANSMDLYQI